MLSSHFPDTHCAFCVQQAQTWHPCTHVPLLCRSVLAEAVFKEVISKSPMKPFIHVDSASIGPSVGPGLHDPRVMWAAQKAGLNLSRRNIRPFDETVDIVNYDLVLTMDHFDYEEVSSQHHHLCRTIF